MADYTRPKEGFRFKFMGMKLNSSPDSLPPDKYALAINVRAYADHSVRTRPGLRLRTTNATPFTTITDLHAYSALLTDNLPRTLARSNTDSISLDTGAQVGSLAAGGIGACMIPFRPNASPTPYMYIANGKDYQKFSAPDISNNVAQQKVGIAEPQTPPVAEIFTHVQNPFIVTAAFWLRGGSASAVAAGVRVSDTVGTVLPLNTPTTMWCVQVGSASQYQKTMSITIGGSPAIVEDVFPPLPTNVNIAGIFYFSGATGRCIVVPQNIASGPGNEDTSIYTQNLLSTLRHGALIKIGTEICVVQSVAMGPGGSISIETSTVTTHTTLDAITSVPSILIAQADANPVTGQAIAASSSTYSITVGVGTETAPSIFNAFVNSGIPFQPDDYISFGIKVDNLSNLNEMKILFDVGDGTFTQDFYYYTVRPSDITAAVANSATQLGNIQTVSQRATIDEEKTAAAGNQLQTSSSAQIPPGSNTWAQITFSIAELTRVGNDQSKSLQNVRAMQILWNASGTINVATANIFQFFGTFQPDVGEVGAPYLYRVRPRSQVTGVKGNPSPATRYGVSPRRESVTVIPPSATYDPQIDTWDYFRYGGSITSWRYVGSSPSTGSFLDNFSDDAVGAGDELEFDNLEPWPSVDVPNNGPATIVNGTIAVIFTTDLDTINYLPGTLVQLGGQNVYTLWARPIRLTGNNYLLQFVENAGVGINVPYNIQEPLIANAKLSFMWGPDVNGTIFAVGDPLNPGKLYFSKGNTPDAAPSSYNIEITPASEPLLGGEVLDGLSFVASTERWWALYPQPDNPLQRYNFVQQPIERGIAAPYGHCNDGKEIFYWAKDGIRGTSRGSLTDDDLYTLFPHEGVLGADYTYNGVTIYAPDYSKNLTFRLAYSNGFLYAIYIALTDGLYHTLTCDLRSGAWSEDRWAGATPPFIITCAYHVEQQASSSGTRNDVLLFGGRNFSGSSLGTIYVQTDLADDVAIPIQGTLATREFDGGDIRAGEQWGDVYLDSLPASGIAVTPMGNGAPISMLQNIPISAVRAAQPISLGGQVLSNFLGLFLQWTDDFTVQASPTTLYIWQPSFIPKPESITDRVEDWEDGGIAGAKWFQGFVMHADTSNVIKGMTVRDSDSLAVHAFTPIVQHNGESEKAYSFNQPFIAHQVRLEPTDVVPWRLFDVRWIAEPTPEFAETWTTQPSTHGLKGFMHLRQASITYSATAPVTLTVGVFDGTAPASITLPSTGGVVQKIVVPFTFNKGQLYTYSFSSGTPFQIYQDKCEVLVGQWGREDTYINRPLAGSVGGDEAKI